MNVLSLFDGMSCGQIALNRLGVRVDNYYAAEIDKYAIQVTQANFPNTIQLGSVCDIKAKDLPKIDLILAGSPCQGFSFAGKQLAFDDPRSALFFEFIRLLKECQPKYFLLENVRMKKEHLSIITEQVSQCYSGQGNDLFNSRIEPILINSALVSGQNRQRYYWTNIPNVTQPDDKGIALRDILETESISDEFRYGQKSIDYMNRGNEKWQQAGNRRTERYEQTSDKDKSFAITANWYKGVPYNYFKEETYNTPKQVGTAIDINGHDILKRVYSPDGKSPTLNACSGGNREPKVKVGTLTTNLSNDHKISLTRDNEQKTYWRKLTPVECERLQTVPDNYTNHVSNTQRYKMLGNGWTIDVICHILKNIEVSLLEENKESL